MASGDRPVWTARELADATAVTHATARKYLSKLHESGELDTVQVGNATAYYVTDDGVEDNGLSFEELHQLVESARIDALRQTERALEDLRDQLENYED